MSSNPPKIGHLILISGPSAAGKSTLIEALQSSKARPKALVGLPDLSGHPAFLDGNDVLKRHQPIADFVASLEEGATVLAHYDIVHIHRIGYSSNYTDDPFFQVLALAQKITILDLRPDAELLRQNFLAREAELRERKGRARTLWRKWVHDPLRARRHRRDGIFHLDKHLLYQDREWLESCYEIWDQFLSTLRPNTALTLVRLKPQRAADGSRTLTRLN
ncbi:MAG: hypothetical protein EP340_02120 [Alphaproteobacteria bacterium]|nr:MAG: hypothetical protein EP340_02120 [Alphaproteobacteria bacterium]